MICDFLWADDETLSVVIQIVENLLDMIIGEGQSASACELNPSCFHQIDDGILSDFAVYRESRNTFFHSHGLQDGICDVPYARLDG